MGGGESRKEEKESERKIKKRKRKLLSNHYIYYIQSRHDVFAVALDIPKAEAVEFLQARN